MKKMKKILAILLALTMVLGMNLTSMAAENVIGDSDDTGNITVSGIDNESGITVTAYQIVKAKYENNGSFSGFDLVYPDVDPEISLEADDDGNIEITQENLNAIIGETKVDDTTYVMTKSGENYTAEVPVGSYLVVVSGAEAKVYSPMVVSVNYINESGTNAISGGTVTTIADGNAWVKESGIPTFSKVEADVIANTNGDFELGNSIDVGNDIDYKLVITPVPYYGGSHPVFNVVDTLQPGLKADMQTLKVFVDTASGTKELRPTVDYTVVEPTEGTNAITIEFVVGGEYTLNEYQGGTVSITYRAKLEGAENFNENGYKNSATLNFTFDSKTTGRESSITKQTYTYTFDLTDLLLKTGEGDDANALEGAEFTLYSDAECTKPYVNVLDADGVYVTDQNGKLAIKGLEADTYYLKETKAPAGYSVNTHVYKIEVRATYKEDGQLDTWGTYVDDAVEASSLTTIPNTKLINLPSTGGIGTTIFTVAGCSIMVAAAFFFFASRKKEN